MQKDLQKRLDDLLNEIRLSVGDSEVYYTNGEAGATVTFEDWQSSWESSESDWEDSGC